MIVHRRGVALVLALVSASCLMALSYAIPARAGSTGDGRQSSAPPATAGGSASTVQYERLWSLKEQEGVFAYARISPDGRTLAYASMMPETGRPRRSGWPEPTRTFQTVIDLAKRTVVFSEEGIDAYWSPDGERMIYLSQAPSTQGVTIRHHRTGQLVRNVAPDHLGDYFSWARQDGKDLILTIQSNYYFLNGDSAVLPSARIVPCPEIGGRGERPLISKDGRRATTFVKGTVVVRSLTACDDIIDTGLQGAKADFSWDGRYVAFHVPKTDAKGYQIVIVDLQRRTMRLLGGLAGSSLFPSWTKDGRLCFRYDGDDYRGFMMASNVLSGAEQPLPASPRRVPAVVRWSDVFPDSTRPPQRLNVVMVWASWSAHSPYALDQLQRTRREVQSRSMDVSVSTALELSTRRADADRLLHATGVALPEIAMKAGGLQVTEALNQIPALLVFRDGVLVDRRLGAQSEADLLSWVRGLSGAE